MIDDELSDARARRDAIREEVARVDRALAESRAMHARREEIARALADVGDAIPPRGKRMLPLLSNVRIASPCSARWEDMRGDDRARHCASCEKTVYDLSAMTADEAEALLHAHGESLCVQLHRRADGTILTADCVVGVRRKMRRKILAATAAALTMSLASLAVGATVTPREVPTPPHDLVLDRARAARNAREQTQQARPLPPIRRIDPPPAPPRGRIVRGGIRGGR